MRHDGGDAETGTGIEAGAGLRYAGEGFSVEGSVRTLIAHEETGYEEWGAAGTVRIDPGESGRGLSLTVAPTWGAASSGVDRLWSLADTRGLSPDGEFEAGRRLETELGYGLGGPDGLGTVTPYAGLALSDTGERTWRLGARWRVAPSISLNLEGTRGEPANDDGTCPRSDAAGCAPSLGGTAHALRLSLDARLRLWPHPGHLIKPHKAPHRAEPAS